MNIELLKEVRDAIDNHPKGFNQRTFGNNGEFGEDPHVDPHACGGACCIAGWAVFLSKRRKSHALDFYSIGEYAQDLLELSTIQRRALFDAFWPPEWLSQARSGTEDPLECLTLSGCDPFVPNPDQAVIILDHIINKGLVEETGK